MLDIRLVREKPEEVRTRLTQRDSGLATAVDELLSTDVRRREIITQVESLKSECNALNKQIGAKKKNGEPVDDILSGMKEKSNEVARLNQERTEIEEQQKGLLLTVPNLPHPECPVGSDAEANPVIKTHGEKPEFAFEPKDHVQLVESLGLVDFATATKISGSGFILYKGMGARLERALIQFLLDLHTREHGYTEVSPPFLILEECMVGTGQLPKFAEDMYGIEAERLYLAPTAEVPVTNMHREEILPMDALPIRYAAYTPCFRKEAGSAGRESRGMTRVHQFDKVELVKIVEPSKSYEELEALRANAEKVLELLGLHYRTIELCTGDLGFSAAKCYDIEVWAPGAGQYLEVSSCSNFEDFQARRMQLRYKDADGKNQFCHTLNGSGTALARLYIALLESGQQEDGSILLPEILEPYVGTRTLKP